MQIRDFKSHESHESHEDNECVFTSEQAMSLLAGPAERSLVQWIAKWKTGATGQTLGPISTGEW